MAFIFNGNEPRRPMTDAEWRQAQATIAMGRPNDIGSGLSSVAQALAYRARKNGQFPAAPGAGPMTGLFAFGSKSGGGLY